MKLSIIIPIFNEEATLEKVLQEVVKVPTLQYEKEIILVDDGSTDRTRQIISRLKGKPGFVLLEHPQNMGKGMAIQTGLKAATGQAVIIQDADLEYSPTDWPGLLKELKPGLAAVYGSRNIKPKKRGYLHYVLGVWLLTKLNNLLFGSQLTDTYTCYKLFPAQLIKSIPLSSHGFEIEAEITAKILKKGLFIKEVPINYSPRKFSQGKKIRFWDGLIGLWTIIKNRLF